MNINKGKVKQVVKKSVPYLAAVGAGVIAVVGIAVAIKTGKNADKMIAAQCEQLFRRGFEIGSEEMLNAVLNKVK